LIVVDLDIVEVHEAALELIRQATSPGALDCRPPIRHLTRRRRPGQRWVGTTVAPMAGRVKDMDRWLGNGGMEVIGLVGASFEDYGGRR